MKHGTLADVFRRLNKTAILRLRLSPEDKASIRAAAGRVGTTMSGYIRRLHRYAVGKRDG